MSTFFKVGTDEAATFIINDLKAAHISLSTIVQTPQTKTGVSFIIPSPSGNHTILVHRGANLTITDKEIPWDAITAVDHLYITSLVGPTSYLLPAIAQHAARHGIPVATNPGTSQLTAGALYLRQALPFIDILIMNAHEAQLLMKTLVETTLSKPSLGSKKEAA